MKDRVAQYISKYAIIIIAIALFSISVLAANDPGHDTLYIEQNGDSELNGTLNITQNISIQGGRTTLSGLNLFGNGATPSPGNPYISGTTNDLYLDGQGNIYIKYISGGDTVFVGVTGTATDLNVSGVLYTQGNAVVQGTTLTVNGFDVCLEDGTNCPAIGGASSAGGWTNTTTTTSTGLNVNADSGTFFLNATSNLVGINTTAPAALLDVQGKTRFDVASIHSSIYSGIEYEFSNVIVGNTYGDFSDSDTARRGLTFRSATSYPLQLISGEDFFVRDYNLVPRLSIRNGLVGINTINQTSTLQVNGTANVTYLTIASATAGSCDLKAYSNGTVYCGTDASGSGGDGDGGWANTSTYTTTMKNLNVSNSTGGTTFFVEASTGFAAIGTKTPLLYEFTIDGLSTSAWMQIRNANSGSGYYDGLFFGVSTAGAAQIWSGTSTSFFINGTSTAGSGDVEALTIARTSNVGIGFTSPTNKLQVNGRANVTTLTITNLTAGSCDVKSDTNGNIYCGTDASGSAADGTGGWTNTSTYTQTGLNVNISSGNLTLGSGNQAFELYSASGNTIFNTTGEAIFVSNVSIGSSNAPTSALQVSGLTNTSYLTIASATAASCDLKAYTNGTVYCGTDASGGSGNGNLSSAGSAGYIPFFNNNTQVNNSVAFQNGTFIGIGTTTPSTKLHVEDTATPVIFQRDLAGSGTYGNGLVMDRDNAYSGGTPTNEDGIGLTYRLKNSTGTLRTVAVIVGQINNVSENTGSLAFHTKSASDAAAVERVRINGTGSVGINTPTPQATLHVNSTNNDHAGIRLDASSGKNPYIDFFEGGTKSSNVYWDGNTNTLIVNQPALGNISLNPFGTNVGIGLLAPSSTLQVNGTTNTTYLRIANATAGSCDLKADTSGNVYCGTDASGSGGDGTGGWTNTTTMTTTSLNVNVSNGVIVTGSNISIGSGAQANYTDSIAIGQNAKAYSQAAGTAIAIGPNTIATHRGGVAIGGLANASEHAVAVGLTATANAYGVVIGRNSYAHNDAVGIGAGVLAGNYYTVSIGESSQANAQGAIAIGGYANSTHVQSIALGFGAKTTENNQLMIGNSTSGINGTIHGNWNTTGIIYGRNLVITNNTAGSCDLKADTNGNVYCGTDSSGAGGSDGTGGWTNTTTMTTTSLNVNVSNGVIVTGSNISIGSGAQANYTDSIAIGQNAKAYSQAAGTAIAIGPNTIATHRGGVAIGGLANASEHAVAVGLTATANAYGVVIGRNSYAHNDAVGIGAGVLAGNYYTVSIGESSQANAQGAIAIGGYANSTHVQSIALGFGAKTTENNQLMIGNSTSGINGTIHGNWNTTGIIYGRNLVITNNTAGSCDLKADTNGNVYCGTDSSGAGGSDGTGGWTNTTTMTTTSLNVNVSNGVIVTGSNISIGSGAQANYTDSIAIGQNAKAYSQAAGTAIAIGPNTIATHRGGVAIGGLANASEHAVAVGLTATANAYGVVIGRNSYAHNDAVGIGAGVLAGNYYTVSIGESSQANAQGAIAIGGYANSTHVQSIALGFGAKTTENNQLMIGNSTSGINGTIHGNWNTTGIIYGRNLVITNNTAGSCDLKADTNGNVYCGTDSSGAGGSDGTGGWLNTSTYTTTTYNVNITGQTTVGNINVTGSIQTPGNVSIGPNANANGSNSIAIGRTAHSGFIEGISIGNSANASYVYGIAIGANSYSGADEGIAIGRYANSAGSYNTVVGSYATATDRWATAVGQQATTKGEGSVALGRSAISPNNYAIATGYLANSSGINSIAIGANAQTVQDYSLAIGGSSFANYTGSISIGNGANTYAGNGASIAIGTNALVYDRFSIAIGENAEATGDNSIVMGRVASANAYSVALGISSYAYSYATAVGKSSSAADFYATAIGQSTYAQNYGATALGSTANASSDYSIAIGYAATARDQDAIAMGTNSVTNSTGSIVIGANAVSHSSDGYATLVGYMAYSGHRSGEAVAIGNFANASDRYSVAIGSEAKATDSTVTIGRRATSTGGLSVAVGHGATSYTSGVAIGYDANTSQDSGVAIGRASYGIGDSAIALGRQSQATNTGSIAIGFLSNATTQYSTAIGPYATSQFANSIAIGYGAQTNAVRQLMIGNSSQGLNGTIHGDFNATGVLSGRYLKISNTTAASCDLKADTNGNVYCGTDATGAGGGDGSGGWTNTSTYTTYAGTVNITNTTGATILYVNSTTRSVGIGTTAPLTLLDISSGTSGDAILSIQADTDNSAEEDNPRINFLQDGAQNAGFISLEGDAGATSTGSLENHLLIGTELGGNFGVQVVTNDIVRTTVDNNGLMGIGTTTPSQRLHVQGNLNVSGNILYGGNLTSYGADFAESFIPGEEMEPGDVVCLSDNYVIYKCEQASDNSVAGVVSQRPTIIGNAGLANSIPVGVVGIVKTKVVGPVEKFDLLTTSDVEGHAQSAILGDFGSILGKAMQSCDEGTCEIMVLVGLR